MLRRDNVVFRVPLFSALDGALGTSINTASSLAVSSSVGSPTSGAMNSYQSIRANTMHNSTFDHRRHPKRVRRISEHQVIKGEARLPIDGNSTAAPASFTVSTL